MQEVNNFLKDCLKLIKDFYEEVDEDVKESDISIKWYNCTCYMCEAVMLSEKDSFVFYITHSSSHGYLFKILDNFSTRQYQYIKS